MKQYNISLTERLTYTRSCVVSVPDDVDENELRDIAEAACEAGTHFYDRDALPAALEDHEYTIIEETNSDFPEFYEIEVEDVVQVQNS